MKPANSPHSQCRWWSGINHSDEYGDDQIKRDGWRYIYWCNQREDVAGIAWPKYQEQEKLDHNIWWAGKHFFFINPSGFLVLHWHRLILWWAPQFCIFVYMEGIKSYGMNLEQNLLFSWASFKNGGKQGTVDGWKEQQSNLLRLKEPS